MTLKDSHKFTSSPELRGGRSRYVARDGLITNPFGQVHAPASLSARQAKAADLLMSGTYGPPCIGWSGSAALSSSLASNLAALTQTTGSTLYKMIWKAWVMPSARSRFRLRASVPRTGVTALIGWPTPTASNVKNAYQDADRVIARRAAGRQSNLQDFAALTGWTTPSANDGRRGGGGDYRGYVRQQSCTDGENGWMADANSNRSQRGLSGRESAQGQAINGSTGFSGADNRPGPVNGMWSGADWLYCRDGKWRPVKPGLKPLVNGLPGRVGQLRAYGNAINIEAATAFIKAYMAAVDHV